MLFSKLWRIKWSILLSVYQMCAGRFGACFIHLVEFFFLTSGFFDHLKSSSTTLLFSMFEVNILQFSFYCTHVLFDLHLSYGQTQCYSLFIVSSIESTRTKFPVSILFSLNIERKYNMFLLMLKKILIVTSQWHLKNCICASKLHRSWNKYLSVKNFSINWQNSRLRNRDIFSGWMPQ